jgi:hypothetical protein
MKGATAAPELPTDPMRESDEICILRGMSRWKICTADGYIGPSSKPENATATESPRIDGTNQMRSSKIKAWEGNVSKARGGNIQFKSSYPSSSNKYEKAFPDSVREE